MSYARFLDSDVYVFATSDSDGRPCIECCACQPTGREVYNNLLGAYMPEILAYLAYSTADMIAHLRDHERRGDDVPDGIYDELWADDAVNFPLP